MQRGIFLLVITQSLTTNKWHSRMDAALVGAIMSTNFKIEDMSMSARRVLHPKSLHLPWSPA